MIKVDEPQCSAKVIISSSLHLHRQGYYASVVASIPFCCDRFRVILKTVEAAAESKTCHCTGNKAEKVDIVVCCQALCKWLCPQEMKRQSNKQQKPE